MRIRPISLSVFCRLCCWGERGRPRWPHVLLSEFDCVVASVICAAKLAAKNLDPTGLDGSGDHQQHCGFQLLLELNVELLGVSMERLKEVVRDEHYDSWVVSLLLGGELDGLCDLESFGFGEGSFDLGEGSADLSLKRSKILSGWEGYFVSFVESCRCHLMVNY